MPNLLHVDTPLLHSVPLTRKIGSNVWLKLENLQPAGSFKIRGIGNLCSKAVRLYGSDIHLVCSSGGNAGLATAYAGRQLDVPVTIVVPKTTSEFMREKIEGEGAEVIIHGEVRRQSTFLKHVCVDDWNYSIKELAPNILDI